MNIPESMRWKNLSLLSRIGLCLIGTGTVGALGVAGLNLAVTATTAPKVFNEVDEVPTRPVALVLGTGLSSPYLHHRLDAVRRLYESGKISHILVSGDNHTADYNEPEGMKRQLVRMGLPAAVITCDYAGLRTLDSVIRARAIFGQQSLIIVSQRFHLYRAIFIARHHHIDAVGYAAETEEPLLGDVTLQREWMARILAVIDLYLLDRKPRHLGKEEFIQLDT